MSLLDTIQGGLARILPNKAPAGPSGGIGNAGVVSYDDDVSLLFLWSISVFYFCPLHHFRLRLSCVAELRQGLVKRACMGKGRRNLNSSQPFYVISCSFSPYVQRRYFDSSPSPSFDMASSNDGSYLFLSPSAMNSCCLLTAARVTHR